MGEIELGSEKQKFTVLFDTGSSYIWIGGNNCSKCKDIGITNLFDCKKSSTCQNEKGRVSIEYGIGKAKGHLFKDNLFIDGLKADN